MCNSSQSKRRGFTLVELLVVIGVLMVLIAMLLPAARRSLEAGRQVVCLNHMRQIAQAALMYCHDNDGTFPGVAGVDPPSQGDVGPLPFEWVYWESTWTAPFNDPTRGPVMRYLGSHSLAAGNTPSPLQADLAVLRCPSDDPQSHMELGHQGVYGIYPFSYAINIWTAQWPSSWSKTTYVNYQGKTYNMIPAFRLTEVRNPSQTIFFVDEDARYIDDGTFTNMTFLAGADGWAEPASYIHDVHNRADFTPWDQTKPAGIATANLDTGRRANVVFCDGHGEFVTQGFIANRAHYDPHYDGTTPIQAP